MVPIRLYNTNVEREAGTYLLTMEYETMRYDMTRPCTDCPFLEKHQYGYTVTQLQGYSSGEFACHKTAELDANGCGKFVAQTDSVHCAGALIYLEKREAPHQMMRICERLGMYDRRKLDMEAKVR